MLEGYEGEKVVAVLKMSHALADGAASRELLERLYAEEPSALESDPELPAWSGEPRPSRRTLLRDALRDLARNAFYELPRLSRVTRAARRAMRLAPISRLYAGRRISILSSPVTPFAGTPGRDRSFHFTTVLLEEAREIRRNLDCTLNDVVLATAAGAVRAYLRSRRALPGLPILAHMPASIRGEHERSDWGNRITSRPISLPTHIADPVARLRAASQVAGEVKEDLERRRGANVEDWLRWLPPFASKGVGQAARMFVRLNPAFPGGITVSSVPGPRRELHAPGGPVENIVSVGHVKYVAGLNITVWSYAGKLNFGLYTCPESVPDPGLLADMLTESFEELRKAATREASRIS
jgi:WS/DGAT/MGAT family acyltransferase